MENVDRIEIRRFVKDEFFQNVTLFADKAEGIGSLIKVIANRRLVALLAFDGKGGRIEITSNQV